MICSFSFQQLDWVCKKGELHVDKSKRFIRQSKGRANTMQLCYWFCFTWKSCNFCTFAYPVTQPPCSDPNIHECTTLMAAVRPLAGSLPQSLPKPGFPSQNPSLVTSPYLSVKISANPQLVSRYMCRNCAAWTDMEFVKSLTVTKIPKFFNFTPKNAQIATFWAKN